MPSAWSMKLPSPIPQMEYTIAVSRFTPHSAISAATHTYHDRPRHALFASVDVSSELDGIEEQQRANKHHRNEHCSASDPPSSAVGYSLYANGHTEGRLCLFDEDRPRATQLSGFDLVDVALEPGRQISPLLPISTYLGPTPSPPTLSYSLMSIESFGGKPTRRQTRICCPNTNGEPRAGVSSPAIQDALSQSTFPTRTLPAATFNASALEEQAEERTSARPSNAPSSHMGKTPIPFPSPSTMGITTFWEIVKAAAQIMSLKELCAREGFLENRREIGTIIIGVDACLWLTQCQAVFHKPRHAQIGKNPELKALFYKLAALNQAGITAVFVFDGPNKAAVKRNKQVKAKPHWLVAEFTKLIDLFGFHHHMAPGEADAELGYLDYFGCIDGILTDDGDVAVFGARRIFRKMNKSDKDEITVYTSESIQNNIGLTRGAFYCLLSWAAEIMIWSGFLAAGHRLHMPLLANMVDSKLEDFLVQWRDDLRTELATNSCGFLRSKQKALSSKIPETFPSLRVLSLYVRPTTSWSAGFVPPPTENWVVKLPALPELAVYCKSEFDWKPAIIVDKFERLIFSGLFTRRLTLPLNINQQIHVINGFIQEGHPPLSAFLNIIRVSQATAETSKKYQVKIATGGLSRLTLSALHAPFSAAGSASTTVNAWIAAPLMEHYFPLMVNAFNKALHLPLLPVPSAMPAAAAPSMDFKESRKTQPSAVKWLGSIDVADDKGEGGSKGMPMGEREVIDLTGDSENDEMDTDLINLDSD
ncbi:hypothetical protein B0H12DRAFT_1239860 [Mycena haematopus]|nr:hypothetical protein B0H12DRAFT_1239860 [Mycena haematopus]